MNNNEYTKFRRCLRNLGYEGPINEAAIRFLNDTGYTGSYNEAWAKYLKDTYNNNQLSERMNTWVREFACSVPETAEVAPSDESFSVGEGGGETTIDPTPWVRGSDIRWSLVAPPAGITINERTGLCTVSTVGILVLSALVFRARNLAGSLDIEIQISISL